MKKIYNLTNSHHKDGQEKSRKIYRSISDHVKRLDDARGCADKITDLFTPSVQVQRSRLQEYCERLIFADPLAYGVKAEELLWRKAYYDVVSTAKRLKKHEYTAEEKSSLIAHINAGIGHYHHYISRLQTEFDVDLEGSVDFYVFDCGGDGNGEVHEWAYGSVHRSLIYLGDLSRYKLDVYPNWDPNLAVRYYSQALLLKPDYGMPHNQMGTLALSLNQHLDATYHYIQCLMCKNSFEGTENNLNRLFEKNTQYLEQLPVENPDADCIVQLEPTEHIRRFTARFLLLADVWYFNKKIPHVYDLCHQTNLDLQECLSFVRPVASESSGSQNGDTNDSDSVVSPSYLCSDMVFKIIVVCLLCITKLQRNDKNSHQLSNVIAFTLAVYSQLIQHTTTRIQEGIYNFPLPDKANGKKKRLLRRRKKLMEGSDEESDYSEADLSESESESDSISGILDIHSSSEDEDVVVEEEPKAEPRPPSKEARDLQSTEEILKKSRRMDAKDVVDIVSDEIYLQSVKVLSDWLISDVEVLKSCGKSTRSLFSQVVNLLNLVNLDGRRLRPVDKLAPSTIRTDAVRMPLPEDVLLKGLDVLGDGLKDVDWNYFGRSGVSKKDEVLVRMAKLAAFGHRLEKHAETGVQYDPKTKVFSIVFSPDEEIEEFPAILEEMETQDADANGAATPKTANKQERETKGQLMKHMGQLWLAAEVKDLETRVKGKMSLSPYLVVDVEALIKYMYMVKQLVYSRKFIVLVPSAVLSALDDLKKVKLEAREAIRWLESQFDRGNRFFRAQRAQERLPLPFIKYPKKKDKESFVYIQIIECCHYLAEQQKRATNLVTLLMGDANALNNTENREISYVGLAQSAGVNLELITEFYAKWKKAAKGKR